MNRNDRFVDLNILIISPCMYHRINISSRFSSNSEANASELLENLEDMFLRHYMVMLLNILDRT